MVLGGLLVGFEAQEEGALSRSMRKTLEDALVQAANLALVEVREGEELGAQCVVLVLNHCFGILGGAERARLDYDVSWMGTYGWFLVANLYAAAATGPGGGCLFLVRRVSVWVFLGCH